MGHPLQKAARIAATLVFGHITLRREGGAVRVTLAPKTVPGTAVPAPAPAADEFALERAALARLLDANPLSRKVFKHLRFLEVELADPQKRTLTQMPVSVLEKALQQLDTAVLEWTDPALVSLRTRLGAETAARGSVPPQPPVSTIVGSPLSDFRAPEKLQVCEASLSSFFEAAGTPPKT